MILFLVLSLSLSLSRRARSNQIEELTRLVRKYENWAREGASETLSALSCDVLKLALREPLLPGFLRALHLEGAAAGLARLGFQTVIRRNRIESNRIKSNQIEWKGIQ